MMSGIPTAETGGLAAVAADLWQRNGYGPAAALAISEHPWTGLGVGYVISGEYFGWNLGLPLAGSVGMLIAVLTTAALIVKQRRLAEWTRQPQSPKEHAPWPRSSAFTKPGPPT